MAMKERNEEVAYSRLIGACPKATLNAATQKPVGKKRVYDILRADCYDQDPADAWTHGPRMSRAALTDDMKSKRVRFADEVLAMGPHEGVALREPRLVRPLQQRAATDREGRQISGIGQEEEAWLRGANARAASLATCVAARRS